MRWDKERVFKGWQGLVFLAVLVLGLYDQVGWAEGGYEFIAKWGSYGTGDGQFIFPNGVAVDSSGNVYATVNHRIQKFTSSGNFITKWGSEGTGNGQFVVPWGVAVDSSGNVYVADIGNHRIQKFTSSGNFITKWGSKGTGNGQFVMPNGVAVDSSGNVYVADSGNDLIHYGNDRIQKFDSSGNFITKWGSEGRGDGQFDSPHGVAVDSSGNVYVADTSNHRIQKFDSNGNFITKWGGYGYGSGDGQFKYPSGVAVDSSGNVYVADSYNKRIQKFDSSGTFITKWGSYGSSDGQFRYPSGVAVDSSGNVYVLDNDKNCIQKFALLPTANAGSDTSIYSGDCTILNGSASGGTGPYTYSWSPTTNLSNPNIANPTACPSLTTTYTLTVTDNNGYADTDQAIITVSVPIADAGNDVSICTGTCIALNGSVSGGTGPYYTFIWNPGGLTGPNPQVCPDTTTTYTLTVTDGNGCTDDDQVVVSVNLPPTASTGNDNTIYSGTCTTLNSSASGGISGYTYYWSPIGSTSQNLEVCPTTTTVYTLTVTDSNGCTDTAQVTVTVMAAAENLKNVIVYPNPFKLSRGHFEINFAHLTARATIKIFDIAGELVKKIEEGDGNEIATWDGRNDAGKKVASGIYIYLITNPDGQKCVGKIGVIK